MSTYHSIHFHIILSTKHRKPWIDDKWIGDLHGYLGGTVKGLGAVPLKIGGVADHIHMLVGCKTTHCPAELVRETKKSATAWVHDAIGLTSFGWQDGQFSRSAQILVQESPIILATKPNITERSHQSKN